MGHDLKSWWTGSLLDIELARKLVPHQNATTLQVAISVVAAAIWMIKNPKRGFCLPDDIDHEEILKISIPYIEPFVSIPVDWTPLKNLNTKFTKYDIEKPKEEDMWQFTTFLVDQSVRLNAYEVNPKQYELAEI
jgi:homospermidine synthase